KLLAKIDAHDDAVSALAFSRDGSMLVTGGYDHAIKLWEGQNPRNINSKPRITLTGHKNWIFGLAFSPGGVTPVYASCHRTAKAGDVKPGTEKANLTAHRGCVRSIAFAPDGKLFASAGAARTIRIWNAATLENTLTLRGHTATIRGLAFSPDSKLLAS